MDIAIITSRGKDVLAIEQTNSSSDRTLVDTAVYLSRLASDPKEIDPILDTLRAITATWTPPNALAEKDRQQLQKLVSDLKDYLVNRDPLRSFTSAELEDRVAANIRNDNKSQLLPFIVVVLGCIVLAALTMLLPLPLPTMERIYFSVAVLLQVITATNAWYYLSSLRDFKPELKAVFWYISVYAALVGLQFAHYTALALFDPDPTHSVLGLPEISTLGVLAMYVGAVKYADILGVPTRRETISVLVSVLATIPLAIFIVLVRHVDHGQYFYAALLSVVYDVILGLAAALVIRKVVKNLTVAYAKPLRILYIYLLFGTIGAAGFAVSMVWTGHLSGGSLGARLSIYILPPMLLFLYSGYRFKKETSL